MKIQWLDDERTRAIVTRGWWRKRQAEVRRLTDKERADAYHSDRWVFASGDRASELNSWLESERDAQRKLDEKRAVEERNWRPVAEIPEARVRRLP